MEPIVNKWYNTLTKKLLKVRLIMYNDDGVVDRVLLEHIDHTRHIIKADDWYALTLTEYNKANVNSEKT